MTASSVHGARAEGLDGETSDTQLKDRWTYIHVLATNVNAKRKSPGLAPGAFLKYSDEQVGRAYRVPAFFLPVAFMNSGRPEPFSKRSANLKPLRAFQALRW